MAMVRVPALLGPMVLGIAEQASQPGGEVGDVEKLKSFGGNSGSSRLQPNQPQDTLGFVGANQTLLPWYGFVEIFGLLRSLV